MFYKNIKKDNISQMNTFVKFFWIAKGVGWDNLFRRVLHMYRVKSGSLRRRLDPKYFSDETYCQNVSITPDEVRLSLSRCFSHFITASRFIGQLEIEQKEIHEKLLKPCQKALSGEYLFFGHWYGKVGWLPKFNYDPVHNIIYYEEGKHPSEIARSGLPRDDVKLAWETSRFSLAYYFARAYVQTNEEKWSEAFWEMFDAWIEQNPPMQTIAWACGQESTFRMMAILFAASVTLKSPAVTEKRLLNIAKFVWRTGQLIERNINYALSQKNNHGISEAIGLITAAHVLQNSSNKTNQWKQKGEQYLLREIKRQIYDDGSFVQHSMNYHRVMLDDLLWYFSLKKSVNEDLFIDRNVLNRFQCATKWLSEFVDLQSGRCPNYGSNDGAQVLPLSCCEYLDYRPVIQAAWKFCYGKRLFESGIWDEKTFWLTGSQFTDDDTPFVQSRPSMFEAPVGGYYVMRGTKSWCMIRCHSYRDRPGESDMLHFDLWYDGKNIVRDGGSYHYYTKEPIGYFFKSTAGNNTVEIDQQDQMVKSTDSLFLWFYWTKSKLNYWGTKNNDHCIFEGEHYGYRRLPDKPVHKRKIICNDDRWTVIDTITFPTHHQITSRFRLLPGIWKSTEGQDYVDWLHNDGFHVRWKKTEGFSSQLYEGHKKPFEGWESLYYGKKSPVPTICLSSEIIVQREPVVLEYEFFRD
jgi:hypothetical protein